MYESLANFVLALPRESLKTLYLEDVALCAAWYESYDDSEEARTQFAPLRQLFDAWVHEVEAPRTDTMGYRQQPLLRQLIKELGAGNVAQLERDELDLLYFASGLARRSGKLDVFRRVLTCLAPHTRDIEHWRAEHAAVPGCPNLGRRLAVVTEAELKAAEARDVRTFGGLNVPIRGPVYMREGSLRVMTDIPAGCTVVVDQGSCHVRGAVLGNVATTVGCDVLDNIGGVVIARRGNVCAKDIINQATVISKEGAIHALSAQEPRLLFASREITIKGDALQGRYMARRSVVEGRLTGGDLYTSEWAEAQEFITSDNRRLRVCLVRGLSCQDYGEVLNMEASKLLNSAMKLRQRLASLEELIEITEREADDFAGTVLMYILGEEDGQERVQLLQKKRRRQSFHERLITGLRAIMAAAEDRINLMNATDGGAGEAANTATEEQATLEDLRRELALLTSEGSIAPDLQEFKEDILYLGRKLQRRGLSLQGLEQVLARLTEKCGELEEKHAELKAAIDREEAEIEKTMVRAALLERAKAECSRVELLKQLLAAARRRANMDLFRQRANDRYVKLLQRMMENRLSRTAGYLTTTKGIHERIEEIRKRLWSEYMVSLPEHVLRGWAVGGARIQGAFTPGILICAWRHLLDDDQGMPRSRIITGDGGSSAAVRRTFVRTARSTIEPVEPAEASPQSENINI